MISSERLARPASSHRPDRASEIRDLARAGLLAAEAAGAAAGRRRELVEGAYTIAMPVVFARITRPVEYHRGHWTCASGAFRLADECVDAFHDDMEAVVDDLLKNATKPIENLEAWVSSRARVVTIDGHRRRRGELGALQRPRLPGWLSCALRRDTWLSDLALGILIWVGASRTAGAGLWPMESWAGRRGEVTGDYSGSDSGAVSRDIDVVLAAMRQRTDWYHAYVERPLGRKRAPVAPPPGDGAVDPRPLVSITESEVDDRRLTDLAALALEAITAELGTAEWDTGELDTGAGPTEIVVRVIGTLFGRLDGIDRVPCSGTDTVAWLPARLADPQAVDRIVADVLAIVGAG